MIALLKSPPGWFTVLLAAAVAGYFAWLALTGAAKLEAAGLAPGATRHNVEIVLGIAPEQFHMTRLQSAGRLIRFEDRSAFIMDIADAALEDLVRNYWVVAVKPWKGLQP